MEMLNSQKMDIDNMDVEETQETFFIKSYYKYFKWNEGLLNYFFSDKKKNVLLYIDEQILTEIGKGIFQNEAVDYKKHFTESVEGFCRFYTKYINSEIICPPNPEDHRNCNKTTCFSCKKCNDCKYKDSCVKDRTDVLAVANHICSKPLKYYKRSQEKKIQLENRTAIQQKLPFFAIVIYVIFKFDNGISQEWQNVREKLPPDSMSSIKTLWEAIHKEYPNFNHEASVYDRDQNERNDYVGRIKYHLPLSAPLRRKLRDAIYKSNVWKFNAIPFELELLKLESSLSNAKENKELKELLERIKNSKNFQNAEAQKVREVIENFGVEDYENGLAERIREKDFSQTIITGKFALAIHFAKDNDEEGNSIKLLTDVQQEMEENGFAITQGTEGFIGTEGYNEYPVKYNGSEDVELKEYKLDIQSKCKIRPIKIEDVVFFYECEKNKDTGEAWYIQTREIMPNKKYFIAVRNNKEHDFEDWCSENNNNLQKYSIEDSQEFLGKNWLAYFSESLKGQDYYTIKSTDDEFNQINVSTIDFCGGIKDKDGRFFINALPYIFVPKDIGIGENDIEIIVSDYNKDKIEQSYHLIPKEGKIIVDFVKTPNVGDGAICTYVIKSEGEIIKSIVFDICSQEVLYDDTVMYGYDSMNCISDKDIILRGNKIIRGYFRKPSEAYKIEPEIFVTVADNMYLVNLLAAYCYNSTSTEIKTGKDQLFEKCLDYARTRVNIPNNVDSKTIRKQLSVAGYININYNEGKCQIVPPAFTKIPRSLDSNQSRQLILLSGCYTRKFIDDLLSYCRDNNIKVYSIPNNEEYLPPTIILDCNFKAADFLEQKHHKCDVLLENDLALSLLSCVPCVTDVFNHFKFKVKDEFFINQLKQLEKDKISFPRIRKDRNRRPYYYIEEKDNMFANIERNMIEWAYLYCYMKKSKIIAIQNQTTLYIPFEINLPFLIQRSLYLMNLQFSQIIKAFVCNNGKNNYYSLMNKYEMCSKDRCKLFIDKLKGAANNEFSKLFRDKIQTKYHDWGFKMKFWKEKNVLKQQKKYILLYQDDDVLAVGYSSVAYISSNGSLRKMDGCMNDVLSMLITSKWQIDGNHLKKNNNGIWEDCFEITNETIQLPSADDYEIEDLIIL